MALHLSFTGTIKEDILERVEIAYQLTKFLLEKYPEKLNERYQVETQNKDPYELMLEIGKRRGCIMSGGRIDEEKVSRLLLDEFKNGKLGRITIERNEE